MKISVFITVLAVLWSSAYGAVREPAVAGTFYPADSAQLAQKVAGDLARVTDLPEIDGEIIALVVPHAGLEFSGGIAAYSYKLLESKKIDNVILCGPSHHYRFDGLSVYGPFITWKTPLGEVKCNTDLCDKLISSDRDIELFRQAQLKEHCLEVQLPYLQTVLGNFQIVPITMGIQSQKTIDLLAKSIVKTDKIPGTVIIASSDWQHYRPAEVGYSMDSLGMAALKNFDPESLDSYLASGQVEMCGGGPVVAVMKAARELGADKIKILKYGDSGDINGDKSSVVGYVAAVIYKSGRDDPSPQTSSISSDTPTPIEGEKLPDLFELSRSDKSTLLKIARTTLEKYLAGDAVPEFEVSDNLKKFGAAFVTLTENGQLRGCIGRTTASEPLFKTVENCAIDAAISDPRFPPVTRKELGKLHIEISVLSPMQPVKSLDEIEVGRDGLMIFKGSNRGLLLPQVATDYGWDRKTFLEQTSSKAGLNKDAYKDPDAILFKFQAVIFEE